MQLVDDVLGGERTLVMVASRDSELDEPGPDALYEVGVVGVVARMLKIPDGTMRILVQATERVRIGDYVTEQPYLVARIEALPDVVEPSPELEALTRNVQRTFSEIIEQIPYLPEELQLAVTNIDEPSALSHLIAGALRIPTAEKQQLLEEVDVTRRLRRLSELLARELEVIQLGFADPVAGRVGDGEGPARVLPARAAEGDPARARRGGRDPGRGQRAARADRRGGAAGGRAEGGRPRALAARAPAACRGRVRRDPHLPRVAGRAAVVADHRGQPRRRARPRGARRRPLRPRAGQGPDPRVPRGPQPESGIPRPDPLLHRPARGRQDEPRPLDRPGARARVRAHLGRRGPRRGGDPRPPPHLHRRDAGDDHPRPARRRHPQPGVHDRRDRQDGRRLPRRPVERDARGARPGPERDASATTTSTCPSTSPRCCSSPRRTRRTRFRRRCSIAWR